MSFKRKQLAVTSPRQSAAVSASHSTSAVSTRQPLAPATTRTFQANCPFCQKGQCPRDLFAFSSRHCYTPAASPAIPCDLARKTIAFVRFVQRRSTALVLSVFSCDFCKYPRGRLYSAGLRRVTLCSARSRANHRHRLSRERHSPHTRRHATVHRHGDDHTPKSHCSLVAQRRWVRRHDLWHAFRHLQHFRHSDHLYRARCGSQSWHRHAHRYRLQHLPPRFRYHHSDGHGRSAADHHGFASQRPGWHSV